MDFQGNPEALSTFPGVMDSAATFLAYQPQIEIELDPGMVLHKPLPQNDDEVDDLSTPPLTQPGMNDPYDYNSDQIKAGGPNLESQSTAVDVIQRMQTSTYRIRLFGFGIRVAYRVPIPSIFKVGGQDPTPDAPHRVREVVIGNYGGIPIYYAEWDLMYMVTLPPKQTQPPPPNLAAHIRGDMDQGLPVTGMQVPISFPETGGVAPGTPPGLGTVGIQANR